MGVIRTLKSHMENLVCELYYCLHHQEYPGLVHTAVYCIIWNILGWCTLLCTVSSGISWPTAGYCSLCHLEHPVLVQTVLYCIIWNIVAQCIASPGCSWPIADFYVASPVISWLSVGFCILHDIKYPGLLQTVVHFIIWDILAQC